jgi:fluoroquinolone transport system permease protein
MSSGREDEMSTLRAFGTNDLKSIRRDPALFYMLVIPPLMIPAARFLLPAASAYLSENFGFGLVPYYPMLLSFFFVLQIPMLFGVLVGLLVLDEKDDDTLMALRVTPISMTGYALYRGAAAVLLGALYVCIALPLTGLLPSSLLPAMVPVALLSGLTAPVFALLLAALARNKVEGLALMKALSVFMLGPLAAYFVGSGWQILFGVLPTYWPAKAFWVAAEGGAFWPHVLVGLAYNLALTTLLLKRFRKKVF